LAVHDPKAFLQQFEGKTILDEIQRVPMLLSYIQARVDENRINGEFVLTGEPRLLSDHRKMLRFDQAALVEMDMPA